MARPSLSRRLFTAFRRLTGKKSQGGKADCQSGLLPYLHLPLHLSAGKEGLIDPDTLIIDAKSGTSGAGRGAKVNNLYCEVNESIKAYGVAAHRHTPEIEEQLSCAAGRPVTVNFTPHLVPMDRGILVTAYASLAKEVSDKDVREIYRRYYGDERFVRVLNEGVCPETRWVKGSNFVDVNFKLDPPDKAGDYHGSYG